MADPRLVPPSEITGRLAAFRGRLRRRGLSGALLTSRAGRFYLAGTSQDGALWVEAERDPVLWVVRDAVRARRETPVEVVPVAGRRELWGAARGRVAPGRPGIEADVLSVADLGRLGLSAGAVEDVSGELLDQRRRKSPWEVGRLEEAGRIAAAVYAHAAEVLRPGLTEVELAGLLFARAQALGHEGLLRCRGFEAYSWHVLSGPNCGLAGANDSPMSGEGLSPAFPVGAGRRTIRRGEPVLVDFGVCALGYHLDQTRTFCLGAPPAWLAEGYGAVEAVYAALRAALLPGRTAGEVFAAGAERARELGLEGYLGPPERRCRFVGHGVGVELVEAPLLAEGSPHPLEAGEVVAVEPKAVFPGGGCGAEDTFLLTEAGPRPLADLPPGLLVV